MYECRNMMSFFRSLLEEIWLVPCYAVREAIVRWAVNSNNSDLDEGYYATQHLLLSHRNLQTTENVSVMLSGRCYLITVQDEFPSRLSSQCCRLWLSSVSSDQVSAHCQQCCSCVARCVSVLVRAACQCDSSLLQQTSSSPPLCQWSPVTHWSWNIFTIKHHNTLLTHTNHPSVSLEFVAISCQLRVKQFRSLQSEPLLKLWKYKMRE